MDKSSCIGQRLSLSPIFLILSLLSATGSSQQLPRAATPCLPNNPKCYFERFANFKIPQLEPLKVGHVRKLKLVDGKEHQMVTTAVHPPIFEIADFLSDEECDHIIKLAKDEGLETSRTMKEGIKYDTRALGKNTKKYFDIWDLNDDAHIDKDEMVRNLENYLDFTPDEATLLNMYSTLQLDKDQDENISFEEFKERDIAEMAKLITRVKIEKPQTKSRHSEQAWIENVSGRSDGIITAIAERVQRLTMLPMEVIKASEYIQVVSYGPTGHYNCHLDSDNIRPNKPCCHILDSDNHCRMCRFATVLYFLDNVEEGGETAFPVADNITFDNNEWIRDSENVCNLAKNCHKANVVVKPEKGKAVLWYNHRIDNATGWLGELDKYSFHGGCNVRRGTKWIANHWISLSEDKEEDIKNWIELDQYEEDEKQVRESNKDISHQEL